ncbi:hypothetical protein L3Q82_003260 [Scortum barcoo]|uniref:Uncharacterized protein n=1 Tax=Scortum barcoo TaxID=214431 RepID=A0ACB8VRW9_9TELE|nr:hypothetical protein L3Q82_003260 [Scortum barcoo]
MTITVESCPAVERTAGQWSIRSRWSITATSEGLARELGPPPAHIQSLGQGRVPQLWKTSCIIPVPKKPHPGELNDFRPVASMTSHVMKTMERLLLHHLRPQTHHALDPLQFAYREKTGVEDAIIFLLHRSLSHLDRGSGAVRITFLDLQSASLFTIQPLPGTTAAQGQTQGQTGRDGSMVAWWQADWHTVAKATESHRGRHRRELCSDLRSGWSDFQWPAAQEHRSHTYTSDFQYNSEYYRSLRTTQPSGVGRRWQEWTGG